ncbi:MAG: hypothetical protein CSA36_06635 [Draconibacterium sp.]|nr:MAG: hypothetical protein CSA36_06635 [Draconibacterium sp.]
MRSAIITRVALIYFLLFLFAIVVIYKLISVQQIKNDRWEKIEANLSKNTLIVEADRGNICADDGSVLATSVPGYYVRIDMAAEGVKRVYAQERDSLAYYLARFLGNGSKSKYLSRMNAAYRSGNRGFLLIPYKVDYTELQKIKKFPILRRGRYGGGLIIEQENKRVNPLGILAQRTIGGLNKGVGSGTGGPVGFTGIENAFEDYLKGKNGVGYKQNLSGRWVERIEIEPEDGMDIITTINVKMQDIAESALLNQLLKSNANWATVILMEVQTGQIKAIANLGKGNGRYYEKDNYALGPRGSYEPGSTFKLVSLMAALEDGLVDTSDVFDTGNGSWYNSGRTITDTHGYGKLTVKEILEKSSNVGVAKVITSCYGKNPKAYADRVFSFGINKPLGLEVKGEGKPYFKYPGDSDWWGTTLAGMSYGYESKMTPLHILTFYNAVANNGKMVKPYLVKEIRDKGALEKRFKTQVIKDKIASDKTISKARKMLEGVCENGTGKSVASDYFKMAGKTGTARIASSSEGYSAGAYLASFAGYFPAEEPRYSMIVTFNNPRGGYYGASVAGPVFKEIAEKVFAMEMPPEKYEEKTTENQEAQPKLPKVKNGCSKDIVEVAESLKIKCIEGRPDTQLAKVEEKEGRIFLKDNMVQTDKVPDVSGMGASNAVFLLENVGLRVVLKGAGKVKKQSLAPGRPVKPGDTVYLTLS